MLLDTWYIPVEFDKHRCLLGQIFEVDTSIRLRLECYDVDDYKFTVAFYLDNEAEILRLLRSSIVGHTIAIFYPVSREFPDGSLGVGVESADEVLVCFTPSCAP
jgi:hypothetical protein